MYSSRYLKSFVLTKSTVIKNILKSSVIKFFILLNTLKSTSYILLKELHHHRWDPSLSTISFVSADFLLFLFLFLIFIFVIFNFFLVMTRFWSWSQDLNQGICHKHLWQSFLYSSPNIFFQSLAVNVNPKSSAFFSQILIAYVRFPLSFSLRDLV